MGDVVYVDSGLVDGGVREREGEGFFFGESVGLKNWVIEGRSGMRGYTLERSLFCARVVYVLLLLCVGGGGVGESLNRLGKQF